MRSRFDGDVRDTVFRFRTALPPQRLRSKFRYLVIFRWPYAARKDGMPRAATLKAMAEFEDDLESALEAAGIGIQAACLTGNGRRTWRYYCADRSRFGRVAAPILRARRGSVAVFRQLEDPAWDNLSEILPLLDCPD